MNSLGPRSWLGGASSYQRRAAPRHSRTGGLTGGSCAPFGGFRERKGQGAAEKRPPETLGRSGRMQIPSSSRPTRHAPFPGSRRLSGSHSPVTLQLLLLFAMPSHQLLLLIKLLCNDCLHDDQVALHTRRKETCTTGWQAPSTPQLSPGTPLAAAGTQPRLQGGTGSPKNHWSGEKRLGACACAFPCSGLMGRGARKEREGALGCGLASRSLQSRD